VPTAFGESFVLRLLGSDRVDLRLEKMGFHSENVALLKSLLKKPNGILLTTGPTGSGKTSTLYAALNYINSDQIKIITVEDPVEYQLEGISQIQVKQQIGYTFANALRSILRQDPDVIMVGEIRDRETAEIAIQSALTGHLVLSTLHTNSAIGAVARLLDMGIEDYLISSTLLGVLAQRLARRLCTHCKETHSIEKETLEELGLPQDVTYYKAKGCTECDFTGYKGRKVIGEMFLIDNEVKEMIKEGINDHQIRTKMKKEGMSTLADALRKMLIRGETSIEEALRVGLLDE
jgi:general secretion pathway protein E